MKRRILTGTRRQGIVLLLAGLVALSSFGCAKDAPVEDTPDRNESEFSDRSNEVDDTPVRDTSMDRANLGMAPVYFALDSTAIRSEYQAALEAGSGALKASSARVVIEGHCDERGSEEYNFALGERRAAAVRKYLYNLGVPMDRMDIVSYGEARPAVSGYGESAWRLNRRAEFKIR